METRALDERLFDDRGRRLLQGLYVCFNYNENVHGLRPPAWTFDNFDRFSDYLPFRGWHFGLDSVEIRLSDNKVHTISGSLGAIGHQFVLEIDNRFPGEDDGSWPSANSFLPRFINPWHPGQVRELLRNIEAGFNEIVGGCSCLGRSSCGPCLLLKTANSEISRYLDDYSRVLGVGSHEPGLNTFADAFDEEDALLEFESRTGLDDEFFRMEDLDFE